MRCEKWKKWKLQSLRRDIGDMERHTAQLASALDGALAENQRLTPQLADKPIAKRSSSATRVMYGGQPVDLFLDSWNGPLPLEFVSHNGWDGAM